MMQWKAGQRVRARASIVEDDIEPDPNAARCAPGWVHCVVGDEGVIEDVTLFPDGALLPTVRFEPTGTATLCDSAEIELVG